VVKVVIIQRDAEQASGVEVAREKMVVPRGCGKSAGIFTASGGLMSIGQQQAASLR
jgi:hypothetical protein